MIDLAYRKVTSDNDFAAGFIYKSWLRSHEIQKVDVEGMKYRDYYDEFSPKIAERIRRHPPLLATFKDDPDVFVAWACGERGKLYFVYVKYAFRQAGIATELIRRVAGEKPGRIYAHTTSREFYESFQKKGWQFRPEAGSNSTRVSADHRSTAARGTTEANAHVESRHDLDSNPDTATGKPDSG
jgi:hypothetical protein